MFILSLSILQTEVPKEKYTLANGVLASLYFAGSSIGLVLGGSIVHYTDWRITFFPLVPLLGILYLITIKYLKVREVKQSIDQNELDGTSSISDNYDTRKQEMPSTSSSPSFPDKDLHRFTQPKPKKVPLDIKGTLLLGTSITFLLLGLSYLAEDNKDYDSNDIALENANLVLALVFFAVSIISIIMFIKIEQKDNSPLLDIKFIASWKIFAPCIFNYGLYNVYDLSDSSYSGKSSFPHWIWGGKLSNIISSFIAIYNCFFDHIAFGK
jgi:MFS family permease